MTAQELYEIVRKEIDIRASTDPAFRQAQRNIARGNGDFTDSAQCSRILSEILGEKLAKHILELPPNEGRSEVCQQLLKDHFDEVSRTFEQVQTVQDRAKGLDLGTVKPPFPAERVREVGHSLDDPTEPDETIQRRCRNAVTNVAHSMHDNFIKENARVRNDLGLKPIIQRFGAGACAWCSAVSGKYRFGEQPADIFRRHDNCQCTIIYDTQVLRGAKTEGGGRSKTWEEVNPSEIEENGFTPTVLTQEQARKFEQSQLNQITRFTPEQARNLSLTTGGNGGRMRVGSLHSIENVSAIPYAQSFESAVRQEVRQAFNTEFETATQKFGRITTIRSVDVLRDNSSAEGNYNDNSNILSLRHADKKNALKIMAEIAQQEKAKGQWSTGHPQHAIRHEIGHAIQLEHKLNDPNWSEKLEKISEILQKAQQKEDGYSLPSLYSGDDRDEFISECIAASYSNPKKQSKTVKQVISVILGDDSNDENT